jgi:hypothetical protein
MMGYTVGLMVSLIYQVGIQLYQCEQIEVVMNIELAPEEYHIKCSYEEALLYCFSLNIDGKKDWRLPTFDEYVSAKLHNWAMIQSFNRPGKRICKPVRDITNV